MARYSFLGRAVDTYGNVHPNVGITIYLNGTSTGAIVYTQRTGGTGVSIPPQITTDAYGAFRFYVDDGDYPLSGNQKFDIVAAGLTYEDIEIMRGVKTHHALEELSDDDHPQYAALSQNETVTGKWTFSFPISGQNPTKDIHLARKGYVDSLTSNVSAAITDLSTENIYSVSAASKERDNREREATNIQILSVSAASIEADNRLQANIDSLSADKIIEGDTSVECIDIPSGYILLQGNDADKEQCTASSVYSVSYKAEEAWNGIASSSTADSWMSANSCTNPDGSCWLKWDFGQNRDIQQMRFHTRGNGGYNCWPSNIKILGSATGAYAGEEITLYDDDVPNAASLTPDEWTDWMVFDTHDNLRYLKMEIHEEYHYSGSGYDWVAVSEVEFRRGYSAGYIDFNVDGFNKAMINSSGLQLGGRGPRIYRFIDEDNMTSDAATAAPTQQSVKAYVDSEIDTANTYADNISAASVEQDKREREYTNTSILAISGAIYNNNYIMADGTVPLTANWDVGNKELENLRLHNVADPTERLALNISEGTIVFQQDFKKVYVATDPDVATQCVLLIHSDTTDESTVFTDSSNFGRVVYHNGTTIEHTVDQQVFGATSIRIMINGNYLYVNNSDELDLAGKDFTMEAWVRADSTNDIDLFRQCTGTGATLGNGWRMRCRPQTYDTIVFTYTVAGQEYSNTFSPCLPDTNVWYHVALTRQGANLRCFVDGTQIGSTYDIGSHVIDHENQPLYINWNGQYSGRGYLDEIRFLIDYAAYTTGFSLPTEPYSAEETPSWGKVVYETDMQDYVATQIKSVSAASSNYDDEHKIWADTMFASTSAASVEQDKRLQRNLTTQITSVSASSLAADRTHRTWADSMFASTSAASVEQDKRLQRNIDTQITALSGSYVKRDGTVPLVANWDVGNYQLKNFAIHNVDDSTERGSLSPTTGGLVFQADETDVYVAKGVDNSEEPNLLIHSNTTDGDTDFTDSSSYGHTVTPGNNAQHDTAQYYFSPTSMLFVRTTPDYLSIPHAASLNVKDSDFCIEAFVRFDTTPNGRSYMFSKGEYNIGTSYSREWGINYYDWSSDNLQFIYSTDGASYNYNNFGPQHLADDTWYHICFTRSSGMLRCYVDGTQVGATLDLTGISFYEGTGPLYISALDDAGVIGNGIDGWIDEFRMIIGSDAGRNGSSFVVPDSIYSAGVNVWGQLAYKTLVDSNTAAILSTSASLYENLNTQIASVSAASVEADRTHKIWADTMFASTSAASVEQDKRLQAQINVNETQIASISAASKEQDKRLQNEITTQILSVSASSVEQDKRLQANIDAIEISNISGNKIVKGNSGVLVTDTGSTGTVTISADGSTVATFKRDKFGLGITEPTSPLHLKFSPGEPDGVAEKAVYFDYNPSGSHTGPHQLYGLSVDVDSKAVENEHNSTLRGLDVNIYSLGDIGSLYATQSQAIHNSATSASVGNIYANYNQGSVYQGSATWIYGARNTSYITSRGYATNAYGSFNQVQMGAQEGKTLGTAYGVYSNVNRSGDGTITTGYLFYGQYNGTVGTPWGVYVTGEDKNYFSGNVGIGEQSPGAKLDVDGDLIIQNGVAIDEFSTDGTLGGNSDAAVPTEKAVKTYVDNNLGSGIFESGITSAGNGVSSMTVNFATSASSDRYTVNVSLSNVVDVNPSVYSYIISNKNPGHFTVDFSGEMTSQYYVLEWMVIEE